MCPILLPASRNWKESKTHSLTLNSFDIPKQIIENLQTEGMNCPFTQPKRIHRANSHSDTSNSLSPTNENVIAGQTYRVGAMISADVCSVCVAMIGRPNAKVLPLPVGATASRSRF